MNIIIKTYNNLTKEQLYDCLDLRSKIFVVEQDCVYLDLDGKDKNAFHVLGYYKEKLVAYARLFKAGDYFTEASIGRIAVDQDHRGRNYGKQITESAISFIENELKQTKIKLSAQTYLKTFYKTLGFVEIGKEYLEDGIPHISMLRA